jgi:hypothetical protein
LGATSPNQVKAAIKEARKHIAQPK